MLHDELEEVNTPVYFHSFMEHAARYGLQYLAEAEFSSAMPGNFPAATVQQLQQMAGNTIEYEQYLDFLRNRTFRQTLLVHQETAVTRALRPDPVSRLYIMTHAGPTEVDLDLASPAVGRFEAPNGAIFASDHPLTKAAYLHLAENRPYAYAFDELVAAARQRLPAPGESGDDTHEQQILAANLLRAYAYSSRLLEFSTTPPAYVATVSDRPAASRLAAWQAERQTRVTNMRHERVMLDDLSRYLLPRLNGRRNRETLWAELQQAGGAGQITLESKEVGNGPRQFTTAALQEELDDHLAWLAYSALLIG